MDTNAAANDRLLIRRFQAQYWVSRDHPAPERIKARLDEAVAKGLSQTLSTILSSWFASSDGGVWLINNLELQVDVNASWEPEQLTRTWASQIARSLAITVQGGSDGENVLWFSNHAAYLARFLVDVAEGRAWSKWYYESFEGLRLLPLSATLRTAICERPSTGRESLYQLTKDELTKVLSALTAQDARRILDGFTEDATAGEEFRCFQAAWDAMQRELPDAGDEWRNALRLYLAASGAGTDVGGFPLRAAVLALLRLARSLIGGSPAEGAKLLAALTNGDRTALYIAAGATNAEVLAPLLRCPSEWVQEVGQTLVRGTGPPVDDTEASPGLHYTPFGGLFLLLPLLDELPLAEATCNWPDVDEILAAAMVRFLLLIKCCGQPRAQRVFYDPLMRDLLGISPSFSPEILAHWQKGISASHLQAFVKTLEDWHTERGAVQGETLILSLAGSVAVLIDGTRGVWLCARAYSPRRPERLVESLRDWIAGNTPEEAVLLCDPAVFDSVCSAFPERQVISLLDDTNKAMAEENRPVAEILARLDKLPDDLAFLALPKSWDLARAFDQALSVGAQGLLRAFAWRLPGFAGSNLPYLHANFLDFTGSLEEEPARRVVRLGHPPLHLILNITGMARATYQLSWLDERPFALFPEG